MAQTVKRLSTMRETWVQSLGREDPLEKKMATHSSTCLENPMGLGAWWATVHGVAKSWTRLSNFTSLHKLLTFIYNGCLEEIICDYLKLYAKLVNF